jgi:hypothetical protein
VGISNIDSIKPKVLPEFVITQHSRDVKILKAIKSYFKCGVVRFNNRKRDVMCYRVRKIEHLANIIVPFFEKHKLKTVKGIDFLKFRKVIVCMQQGKHLTASGLEEIKNIRSKEFKIESNFTLEK